LVNSDDQSLKITFKSTPEFNIIYRDGLGDIQIISSFESDSLDLIEVKVKLDLPITTKNYIESKVIEEIPPLDES
jgi:hypothetical protein